MACDLKQPCPEVLVRGSDGKDYSLPVASEITDVTDRTFLAGAATGVAELEMANSNAAVAGERARSWEQLCRTGEAAIYDTGYTEFSRPILAQEEFGMVEGRFEVAWNQDEKRIFESTMNAVKVCFNCQVGTSATTSLTTGDAIVEKGAAWCEIAGNLRVRPIPRAFEDILQAFWTPLFSETPLLLALDIMTKFRGVRTLTDCAPPQITFVRPVDAPRCPTGLPSVRQAPGSIDVSAQL